MLEPYDQTNPEYSVSSDATTYPPSPRTMVMTTEPFVETDPSIWVHALLTSLTQQSP